MCAPRSHPLTGGPAQRQLSRHRGPACARRARRRPWPEGQPRRARRGAQSPPCALRLSAAASPAFTPAAKTRRRGLAPGRSHSRARMDVPSVLALQDDAVYQSWLLLVTPGGIAARSPAADAQHAPRPRKWRQRPAGAILALKRIAEDVRAVASRAARPARINHAPRARGGLWGGAAQGRSSTRATVPVRPHSKNIGSRLRC